MKIKGVIFTEDVQNVHTGNEFYRAETAAHFPERHANVLIRQGVAKPMNAPAEPEPEPEPAAYIDYQSMTVAELKEEAKALGMKGYSQLRKAELIEQLENEGDNNGN